MINVARMLKQTVICQEAIISNLSKTSNYVISESPNNSKELEILLTELRADRQKLEERRKQLQILHELHNYEVPKEILNNLLRGFENVPLDDPKEIKSIEELKEKHDFLTNQVQLLNSQYFIISNKKD